ncbi:MAG: serine/threonine-protein kinase [Isosphaeraceae bacterium]
MSGTTGDQQVGSYRILQPLGTGGMSSVYRAVHVDSGHEVAIKILTRTLARNSTLLQRFLREAKSAEALVHPNIVTIYDRGIDLGRHYIVLEYVAGGDFHEYVRNRGPLDLAEARSVIRDVAVGLKYAASEGLIHRDIKPSNILRSPDGQIKIIDLGLALNADFEDERVTREGTTVGTVDYMAPEQARDSRAASIRSDIYSLGCTFYYLLTGIPPYPGGDITDKLTRHARSSVPNVADLRPEVSAQVASLIQRMMAKQPEDRLGSYDELIAALDESQVDAEDRLPEYALGPVTEHKSSELPDLPLLDGEDVEAGALGIDSSFGSLTVFRAESQDAELSLDAERSGAVSRPSSQPAPPIRRLTHLASIEPETGPDEEEEPAPTPKAGASVSAFVWIIGCLSLGVAGILLFLGWIEYMDSTPRLGGEGIGASGSGGDSEIGEGVEPALRRVERALAADRRPPLLQPTHRTGARPVNARQPANAWEEPVDREGDPNRRDRFLSDLDQGSERLPDWARSPIPNRIDGPFVVVRRIVEPGDPQAVPELHMALDRHLGGTVELADEGPFYEDDFRVAGESRLIRSQGECRTIVWIQGGRIEAVRQQPAVVVLDRKNLILDGIDLVVNVRDLGSAQTALFSCAGGNLTLRNCTITIKNPTRQPFAFLRVQPSAARSTRIRLEKTLVRGGFSSGIEIVAASTDVVIDKSMILGGSVPLIRVSNQDVAAEQRFFFLDAILAGTGPIIDRAAVAATSQSKPMVIRAYGSAFGRLHGAGIASIVCSSDPSAAAAQQIVWEGNHNLFAGWMGFFAHGKDPTVTVANLAAVRSTWNGAERASQEIPLPWPHPFDLSVATADDLAPFLPNRENVLRQVARPRSGLLEKTSLAYAPPLIPDPIGWALAGNRQAGSGGGQLRITKPQFEGTSSSSVGVGTGPTFPAPPADREIMDLTFDTAVPPWNGDLGAFLRNHLVDGVRYARVRVLGSGSHRCSAVRLPRGISLEIRVEPTGAEPLSWCPDPLTTGPGLIELDGGALVLSNLVLRHDPASHLEHLIHVEDGHLVLFHCQLTTPVSSPNLTGDLIAFRSVTTRPVPHDIKHPVFSTYVDRPVCLVIESLLITNGTALRAELGRGLVALKQTAIAAGEAAIDLIPSRVARWRFETDLSLENCTLTAERTIVRMGPWPGRGPGPDRPWLITSQNCAFIAIYDRKTRETVLLRHDPAALANGSVFWQAFNDAADVDFFIALGEGPVKNDRSREVYLQWVSFWGRNHMRQVTGPRGPGSPSSVRLHEKLHPGRVEPADLILDPGYHPGRDRLSVGADLGRQGIVPKTIPSRRRRS